MTGFVETVMTVFRKEMWEHFRTKRLIVIGAIFAFVFIVVSLYGGILAGQATSELSYRAGANSVLGLVLAFTSFFPGLMAIVISYTAIVGERSRKSLILLTSKPVRRPALFLGKFLSSYFAIVLVYLVVMTVGYIGVVAASGKAPSAEEVGRAYGAVAFVLFAMACWVAFAMFLSASLKNPITVAVSAIMVWFLVMPIVSQIGFIYWMVSQDNDGAPRNVDIMLQQAPGGTATVIFSGLESPTYALYNESGEIPGGGWQGSYAVGNLPPGNYTWTARGTGVNRTGNLAIDGEHGFSVSFGPNLNVRAPADLNVTLTKDGQPVVPGKMPAGPFVNYSFENQTGEGSLLLSDEGRVLFSGKYTLDRETRRGMEALFTQTPPDYVKYNQLVNPDSAMTGYEKVLDPDSRASISPAEGAGALAAFFLVFLSLGLLVFSRTEMI
ncbi:MAG: ABC transporter permease [Euryarchaeota archaeon]|nr:ABC transporter permease [Euryarchaeota archaeon]